MTAQELFYIYISIYKYVWTSMLKSIEKSSSLNMEWEQLMANKIYKKNWINKINKSLKLKKVMRKQNWEKKGIRHWLFSIFFDLPFHIFNWCAMGNCANDKFHIFIMLFLYYVSQLEFRQKETENCAREQEVIYFMMI